MYLVSKGVMTSFLGQFLLRKSTVPNHKNILCHFYLIIFLIYIFLSIFGS